jgi:hypothetical protein
MLLEGKKANLKVARRLEEGCKEAFASIHAKLLMLVDVLFIVGRERVMNKTWLCLVGLILVSSSFQIALSTSDPASYDVMADVNRDRTIDVNDLSRLGRAYGSNLVLPSEPNKVVVTVLSFDKEPAEVENARVAVVDPAFPSGRWDAIEAGYTNSSGVVVFSLSPNKNYTAIAWSASAYSYMNFTTNAVGESSVLICVGEPTLPPIHSLPPRWIVVTLLDSQTGNVSSELLAILVDRLTWVRPNWVREEICSSALELGTGVAVLPVNLAVNEPYSRRAIWVIDPWANDRGSAVYSPDEDGCANVIVNVPPPP